MFEHESLVPRPPLPWPDGYSNVYLRPLWGSDRPSIVGLSKYLADERKHRLELRRLRARQYAAGQGPARVVEARPAECRPDPSRSRWDQSPALSLWHAAMLVTEWSLLESARDEILVRDVYEVLKPVVKADPIGGTMGYRWAYVRKAVLRSFDVTQDWVAALRKVDADREA